MIQSSCDISLYNQGLTTQNTHLLTTSSEGLTSGAKEKDAWVIQVCVDVICYIDLSVGKRGKDLDVFWTHVTFNVIKEHCE